MNIKKGLVISVIVVALLILGGLYYSSTITGNVAYDGLPTSCSPKTVSGVTYQGVHNTLTDANEGVLCWNAQLYECGDISGLNSPDFLTNSSGQVMGSYKCFSTTAVKRWLPSSSCVFNLTTTTKNYAHNNTFGYDSNSADLRFYCLNGQEYECGWDKTVPSTATELASGATVGNYQCFNSSGVSRYFNSSTSCIRYLGGNIWFGDSNNVGLKFVSINGNPTGSEYQLTSAAGTFEAGRTACKNLGIGWDIVKIGSADENNYIANTYGASVSTTGMWVGGNDSITEGTWKWSDGSTFWTGTSCQAGMYCNWASGEPNNYNNGEDCLHFYTGTSIGKWNDMPCTTSYKALCEKESVSNVNNSYLCYNNNWYRCGTDTTGFSQTTTDNQIIGGSFKCNSGQWSSVGSYNTPNVYNENLSNCTCGSACQPFSVDVNKLSTNSVQFEISTKYNLINGSSVTETSTISSVTGQTKFLANVSVNLNCNNKNTLVQSVDVSAKVSGSSDSPATRRVNVNYPSSCSHDCTSGGTLSCSLDSTAVLICGQNDNDQCLDTYFKEPCEGSTGICYNGACVAPNSNSCTPAGFNCTSLTVLPLNSTNRSSGSIQCSLPSQTCISCATNFTWNGTNCLRNNPTCVANNGTCSSVAPTNGLTANASLTCALGNEACYVCGNGNHYYNGSCISNSCSGVVPTGSNVANGSSSILEGASQNWTYSPLPINLGACQWSCNAGFIINETTNNTCKAGKFDCYTAGGACYNGTSLPNSSINMSLYGSCTNPTDSCLACNATGNLTVNSVREFVSCEPIVAPKVCAPNKCLYQDLCVKSPFRSPDGKYCNDTLGSFMLQKEDGQSCTSNYECIHNFCSSEKKCVNLNEEFKKNSGFLKELLCFFKTGFHYNDATWRACLN